VLWPFLFSSLDSNPLVKPDLTQPIGAILLDIEGTTTPLDFVYGILFPYARAHAAEFLKRRASSPEVQMDLAALRREHLRDSTQGLNPPPLNDATWESLVPYIDWLVLGDRKSPALKSLEGKIWQEGYASAALRGELFDDVPKALKRWQAQNRKIAIFSSGSVLAQRLLFSHTAAGDLSRYISGYFDTSIGSKIDPASYQSIARSLEVTASEIVFISDTVRELDAATAAGLQALLSERPGNHPQPEHAYRKIQSFDEMFLVTKNVTEEARG
jgi:enolase-phosphatase E1